MVERAIIAVVVSLGFAAAFLFMRWYTQPWYNRRRFNELLKEPLPWSSKAPRM